MNENSKLGWELRIKTKIRNLRQQAKITKKEKSCNMLGQKGKRNTSKNYNTTRANKEESSGERMKIKKISRKGNIILTKLDIPKIRK